VRAVVRCVRKTIAAIKQSQNLSGQCGQPRKSIWFGGKLRQAVQQAAAKIVKIKLRDQRESMSSCRPFECAVFIAQNMTFEFLETHGSKPWPPKLGARDAANPGAAWACRPRWRASCVACFKQWPVEALSIEVTSTGRFDIRSESSSSSEFPHRDHA